MFTAYKQHDASDCGPTCLQMVVKHYKKEISLQSLRELCNTNREGSSINAILNAGNKIGFNAVAVKCTVNFSDFESQDSIDIKELPLPFIAHWSNNHFVVIYKIKKNKVYIADPSVGKYTQDLKNVKDFLYAGAQYGKVILFEPTESFFSNENQFFKSQLLSNKLLFIRKYLFTYKKSVLILLLLVLFQLILQVASPFLTRITFDSGILNKNLNVLITIFIVQIIIFIITSGLNYINSIVSNKISQNISIRLSSDFISKLFSIPLSQFQKKKNSDFIHRIYDLSRIESFLTHEFASNILAVFGFFVLSVIAIYYNVTVYLILLSYSVLNIIWTLFSLRKRKELDYEKFDIRIDSHRLLTEMIEGVNEIKLSGNEQAKINNLISVQKQFFYNNLKSIKLTQLLSIGGGGINNIGNGFLVFYTAYLTLDSTITIGQMAAIQLVVGQLTSMITTIISSASSIQQTKFCVERILETQTLSDEIPGNKVIDSTTSISFKNVFFAYSDISNNVIDDVSFTFESKKTTAIVGISGSGKTTLMKLILGMIKPSKGEILFGDNSFIDIDINSFRKRCGIVMQDGYIFTDTIINNITMSDESVNYDRYIEALKLSAIYDFINELPIKHETKIGREGLTLSSGQRQRILIARMFYKNPEFILMDEATNSLDSETESIVLRNLSKFFSEKTTIIVAHRLNTVKNADKIIVLSNGKIVETGNHKTLTDQRGVYYELVKNQLDMGS